MGSGGQATAKATAGPSTLLPAKCAGSFAQDDRVSGAWEWGIEGKDLFALCGWFRLAR
jgi:hypothetical protein